MSSCRLLEAVDDDDDLCTNYVMPQCKAEWEF